jgi:hypothetical protein
MPGPVRIAAGVGHPGDAGARVGVYRAFDDPRHGRSGAGRVGVGVEELLPHRREVDQVIRVPEVLLRDLELGHERRLRHGAEERVERLARLEVERAVLDLDEHVFPESAVERHELQVRALDAIGIDVGVVHERAVHHDAAVRRDGIGQHVGAIGVRAPVVLRAGLAFTVGLHDESAEVWNDRVDLVGLLLPPARDCRIVGIGVVEATDEPGRGEIGREVHPQTVGPERTGQCGRFLQVLARQRSRIGVDAVDDRAVDADRRVGARVVFDPRIDDTRQIVPLPQGLAGIAALDGAVEIVPVIEQAALEPRALHDVERGERLARLDEPQQVERAIECAGIALRRDDGHPVTRQPGGADHVALCSLPLENVGPAKLSREGGAWRDDDQRAVAVHAILPRGGNAQQPLQPSHQLALDGAGGRRRRVHDYGRERGPVRVALARIVDRHVAQPEVVARLRASGAREGESEQRGADHAREHPHHDEPPDRS